MVYTDPDYRTRRPLKISVLGAPGVGKTSIALQYVTKQATVETSPTTIEDVFRKESLMTVTDPEILQRINSNIKSCDCEVETLLEEPFSKAEDAAVGPLESADISLSLKITDTAGYICKPKEVNNSSRSFLSRITLKRNRGRINKTTSSKELNGDVTSSELSSTNEVVPVKDRHATNMLNSDGIVLVYSVLDEKSFAVAREIRNRLVQIHHSNNRGSRKSKGNPAHGMSNKLLFGLCSQDENDDVDLPPVFLVGTHADIRVEHMIHEKSSRLYDVSFLRSSDNKAVSHQIARKRRVAKTLTEDRTSVYPHDVYPVISEWKECAGFAEITSHDTGLVEQIFEQLNLAIVTPKDD